MKARDSIAPALIACLACASTLVERRDYILAHPHGWIEVSIDDRAIPLVPASAEEPENLKRPYYCSVDIKLDHESFVAGAAYPIGETPPFSAKTGFRFPAPIGSSLLSLSYEGCDVTESEPSTIVQQLYVPIQEDWVTEVHFDGETLSVDPPRPDPVVTLDDIYQAITGRKKESP